MNSFVIDSRCRFYSIKKKAFKMLKIAKTIAKLFLFFGMMT